MNKPRLDHIAITTPSLDIGVSHVQTELGVIPQVGGEHPRMGTHNYFLKLGDKLYLEIIAINPKALNPNRPRWFALDQQASKHTTQLATWIARTNDIQDTVDKSTISLGEIEPMSRGDVNWHITIPNDGSLPLNGIAPTLIQWQDVHPADSLEDQGCSLVHLEGFHTEAEKLQKLLTSIEFEGEFTINKIPKGEKPYLVARIATPSGIKEISDFK